MAPDCIRHLLFAAAHGRYGLMVNVAARANLIDANLTGTNLTDANLERTNLKDVKLDERVAEQICDFNARQTRR